MFPLAIPYLLNPAGIVTLVTLSAEAGSVAVFAMVLGLLDESRMLVTEKVFGVLLAALAVQLDARRPRQRRRPSTCQATDGGRRRRAMRSGRFAPEARP